MEPTPLVGQRVRYIRSTLHPLRVGQTATVVRVIKSRKAALIRWDADGAAFDAHLQNLEIVQ